MARAWALARMILESFREQKGHGFELFLVHITGVLNHNKGEQS